ncbi:oligosaccharide repeat unit polymerase [Listeria booriae]|nr:oligosaccharide repeat unit polymerase [Listeria booriae]
MVFGTKAQGYEFVALLPVTYAICYSLVFAKSLNIELRVFNVIFTFMQGIRFVIMPIFLVYANYYGGRSPVAPLPSSIETAIWLMIYELSILSLTIFILDYKYKKVPIETINLSKNPNYIMYIVMFILVVLGLLVFPSVIKKIGFFVPGSGGSEEDVSTFASLINFLFLAAKQIVFLLVIWFSYIKHQATQKKIYICMASIALFINIGTFTGTNRADIVITAVASLLIFKKLFPSFFKRVLLTTSIIVPFMLIVIASFRKISSISDGASKLIDYTDKMQVYLAGPYNVAIALETSSLYPESGNVSVLLYDIFRPMLGVGSLISDWPIKYSSIYFNERYFFSDHMTQIIPMIGQGNLFFGILLAPIIGVIVIMFAYFLQRKIRQTKQIEIYYILIYASARLGMMVGQNITILINDLSFSLILFLLFYFLNKHVRLRPVTY